VNTSLLFKTNLASLKLLHRGKVRDIYTLDGEKLLIVQTDRLSAFDVILPTPIVDKGRVLTAISAFWFDKLSHIIANHLTGIAPESVVRADEMPQVAGRAFVVRRLQPLVIEAIVRGYLAGSGWKDYQKTSCICGIRLPDGLKQAAQLPEPVFTPSTKAAGGAHDENISFDEAAGKIGKEVAQQVRKASLELYGEAARHARSCGIIIADTKFEFGLDKKGKLYLIDEVLTPDSSRFWPEEHYQEGSSPPSFDKQFVRDYLESIHWNKTPPAPALPAEIAGKTAQKYHDALFRLTGRTLD
jgi:phosphoribosylaminoimidazole-succinocarboxamide synthase